MKRIRGPEFKDMLLLLLKYGNTDRKKIIDVLVYQCKVLKLPIKTQKILKKYYNEDFIKKELEK